MSDEFVIVPAQLARRIRHALDHAIREEWADPETDRYSRLADELSLCDGFAVEDVLRDRE